MTKVTSKRQVTIPKAVADRYGIGAGDEIQFKPAGEVIHIIPPSAPKLDVADRLQLFEEATQRQRLRQKAGGATESPGDRGWSREDLHTRNSD